MAKVVSDDRDEQTFFQKQMVYSTLSKFIRFDVVTNSFFAV